MFSVVIPVYQNAEFIPLLIKEFSRISTVAQERLGLPTEFVFVVDGSPDNSYELLEEALPQAPFPSQLIMHARNFGSMAAVRTGLKAANGDYIANISADLQEPPELLLQFAEALTIGSYDIVIGVREGRDDLVPFPRLRQLVLDRVPPTDQSRGPKARSSTCSAVIAAFATNFCRCRNLTLRSSASYSGSVFGEVRSVPTAKSVPMGEVLGRLEKLNYVLDSVFAFTDLPIKILTLLGLFGTLFAVLLGYLSQ